MATPKYPQRNTEMPMDPTAVANVRARVLEPKSPADELAGRVGARNVEELDLGNGWKATRRGERLDTRPAITPGGPASPSKTADGKEENPPEPDKVAAGAEAAMPKVFKKDRFYKVRLKKAMEIDGRVRAPGKTLLMSGASAQEHRDALSAASEEA